MANKVFDIAMYYSAFDVNLNVPPYLDSQQLSWKIVIPTCQIVSCRNSHCPYKAINIYPTYTCKLHSLHSILGFMH